MSDPVATEVVGCAVCRHLHPSFSTCDAFPAGIPIWLFSGDLDHFQPLPGDGGIQFAPWPEETAKALPIFDPQKHPRHPKGRREGGRFASKTGGARQAAPDVDTMPLERELRNAQDLDAVLAAGRGLIEAANANYPTHYDNSMVLMPGNGERRGRIWDNVMAAIRERVAAGSLRRDDAITAMARLFAEQDFRKASADVRLDRLTAHFNRYSVDGVIAGDDAAHEFLRLYHQWWREEGEAQYGHPLRHLQAIGVPWVKLPDADYFLHWVGYGDRYASRYPTKSKAEEYERWKLPAADSTENGRVYAGLGYPYLDEAVQEQLLGRVPVRYVLDLVRGAGGPDAAPDSLLFNGMAQAAAWDTAGPTVKLDAVIRQAFDAMGRNGVGRSAQQLMSQGRFDQLYAALDALRYVFDRRRGGTLEPRAIKGRLRFHSEALFQGLYSMLPQHPVQAKGQNWDFYQTLADLTPESLRHFFAKVEPLEHSAVAGIFNFLRAHEKGPDGKLLSDLGGDFRTTLPDEFVQKYFGEFLRPSPYTPAPEPEPAEYSLRAPQDKPGQTWVDEPTAKVIGHFLEPDYPPNWLRHAMHSTHFKLTFKQKMVEEAKRVNSETLVQKMAARDLEVPQLLSEMDTSAVLHEWAMSSNSFASLSVQHAVADRFGPQFGTHLSAWQQTRWDEGRQRHGDGKVHYAFERHQMGKPDIDAGRAQQLTAAIVDAMYDHTQEELMKSGAKTVTLYRGVRLLRPVAFAPKDTVQLVGSNALESWSLQPRTAFQFANPTTGVTGEASGKQFVGVILKAEVPIERVFATARTGFGCLGEFEVLVLNSNLPDYARVEFLVGPDGRKISRAKTAMSGLPRLVAPNVVPQHKAWNVKYEEAKHPRHPKGRREGGRFAPKPGLKREGSAHSTPRQAMPTLDEPPLWETTADAFFAQPHTLREFRDWYALQRNRAYGEVNYQIGRALAELVRDEAAANGWTRFEQVVAALDDAQVPLRGRGQLAAGFLDAWQGPALDPLVWATYSQSGWPELTPGRIGQFVRQGLQGRGIADLDRAQSYVGNSFLEGYPEAVQVLIDDYGLSLPSFLRFQADLRPGGALDSLYEEQFDAVVQLVKAGGYESFDDVLETLWQYGGLEGPRIVPDTGHLYRLLAAVQTTSLPALLSIASANRLEQAGVEHVPAMQHLLQTVTLHEVVDAAETAWGSLPDYLVERAVRNSFPVITPQVIDLLLEPGKAGGPYELQSAVVSALGGQGIGKLWREAHYPLDKALHFCLDTVEKNTMFDTESALSQLVEGRPWAEVRRTLSELGLRFRDLPPFTVKGLLRADLSAMPVEDVRRAILAIKTPPFQVWPGHLAQVAQEMERSAVRADTGEREVLSEGYGERRDTPIQQFFDKVHWGPRAGGVNEVEAQKASVCRSLSGATGLDDQQANAFVHNWAYQANAPTMAAMQPHVVAAGEFDTALSDYQRQLLASVAPSGAGGLALFTTDEVRAALRHMKRVTEDWLNQVRRDPYYHDHPYVRLYRGVKLPKEQVADWDLGDIIQYDDNSLSSWSLNQDEARKFLRQLKGKHGVVLSALVPFDKVLCNARTGYGCLDEDEFVVLGGKSPAYAEVVQIVTKHDGYYDDF